jgi:hypothetical protein
MRPQVENNRAGKTSFSNVIALPSPLLLPRASMRTSTGPSLRAALN